MSSSVTVIATSQTAAFVLSEHGLMKMPLPPPTIATGDSDDADSHYDLGYGEFIRTVCTSSEVAAITLVLAQVV
jgi:hypothetical protein